MEETTLTTRNIETARRKQRLFFYFIFVVSCFAIFVLPFFLPPPYLAGISVANVAGFNNKVASLSAAALSVLVFFVALKTSSETIKVREGEYGSLSRSLVFTATVIAASILTVFSSLVARSHMLYLYDAGYFIHQISMHADYGRKLYEQIEFPYGPLIFTVPLRCVRYCRRSMSR